MMFFLFTKNPEKDVSEFPQNIKQLNFFQHL